MTLNSDMTWSGPSEYRDSILLSPSTRSQSQCHLPVKLLAIPVENVYDSHSDPPLVGWPEESSIDLYALGWEDRMAEITIGSLSLSRYGNSG